MRHATTVLGLGTLVLATGCTNFKWSSIRNPHPPVPAVASEAPTAERLVAYLNQNAQQMQSLECRELDLDCKQKLQSVGLRGQMVCQKPRSFRMNAKVVGNMAADIGSNDQEFWFWISKADPPYLYHCSYQDFAQGTARLPFPFQPEWVMEALGMADYGPAEKYRVKVEPQTVQLWEDTTLPQGQRVKKAIVFNRGPGRTKVSGHYLFDAATGQQICRAEILEEQTVKGAVLPRRVKLVWPAEQMQLTMRLDEVDVNNPIDAQRTARLFTRPSLANVQSYDLGRGLDVTTGQVRRAGGVVR